MAPLIAKEGLIGDRWTEEEILCPLFPKVYLSRLSNRNEECRLRVIQKRMSRRATVLQGLLPHEINRRNNIILRAYDESMEFRLDLLGDMLDDI